MNYLLDTNAVIGILRGRKPELLARVPGLVMEDWEAG